MRSSPWLTESSIKFLNDFLISNDKSILEFGMGASTIWLSQRCKFLTSVDHDPIWFNEVKTHINNSNVFLNLFESNVIHGTDYIEKSYSHISDQFDDESLDMILIDGRSRVDCFFRSESKLRRGGIMVLDNSERIEYNQIFDAYEDKQRFDFVQNTSDSEGFFYPGWTTTCWIK